MNINIDFEKGAGLVPVIVQEADTKEVLMQAYANKEAVELTLKEGYAYYYSRSRKSLWKKGETSGHLQKIVKVMIDCDEDCLLYIVHHILVKKAVFSGSLQNRLNIWRVCFNV